ncbi:MAG: PilZ domain-containing protein [Myxococcales bacterium]|nr:PilZ domain-containing protein [Myxococcales bacterium]
MGIERRRFSRVPLDVTVIERGHRGEARVRARDISEEGMSYTGSWFAPRLDGQEVTLEFRLPGDPEPVRVLGVLADERCLARTSETCVVFVWPRQEDLLRIRRFISFGPVPARA